MPSSKKAASSRPQRSRDFVPRLVGALALLIGLTLPVLHLDLLERLRLQVWDLYQRLAPREAPADGRVRVVDIDNASLEAYGQWPWPRTRVAELVDRLNALGASAIAFDIVFAEPDRTSPAEIAALYPDTPAVQAMREEMREGLLADHDAVLAAAIARAPVVTGFAMTNAPDAAPLPEPKATFSCAGSDPSGYVRRFKGAVVNLPGIAAAAKGMGQFGLSPDGDGIVRRVPLVVGALRSEETNALGCMALAPSLTVEALRVGEEARRLILRASDASGEFDVRKRKGITAMALGDHIIPLTTNGEMWVHYSDVPWRSRMISARDILAPDADLAALREKFAGAIVYIGTSAEGLQDLKSTPLSALYPGVLVHAEVTEQIQQGDYLMRPDWAEGAEFLFLLFFGLAMLWLLPAIGAVKSAILALLAIGLGPFVSWYSFAHSSFLLDMVYPSAAATMLYLFMSAVLVLREEREKGRVRTAFGRYLAPTLVERLAAHPEELRLGGEVRDLTVLFSDIRGFTTIAEGLEADRLTNLINAYLTPMTEILMSRQATIDKYIGDAIMAFWNAPLPVENHAREACRASLLMHERLRALNPVWHRSGMLPEGRTIQIGIGLNSGQACVGNLGSEQRFDYSVLGDVVNTASRLEGQSKTYGVGIVLGEDTRLAVPEFAAIELDLVRLKGKDEPERVYALLGEEKMAGEPAFQRLQARIGEALAAYRKQDWDAAETAFAAAAPDVPKYGVERLVALYRDRIAEYRANPPGSGWDGVYVATEK